jgi:LmbE family N-acetylglucosaminyl deacetylase
VRQQEAVSAADSIGGVFHPSLTNDLEIFYDHATLTRLAAVMREVAPEILLVHSPADYMEDHTNACRLAVTAAFARGMPNYPTEPPSSPVDQKVTIYHAQPHGNCDALGAPVRPSLFVDVGDVMEAKTRMLACHKSQRQWLDTSQGLDSYLETMKDVMREVGRMSGRYEFAEGWRRHSHLGFCGAEDNPLARALAGHVAVLD